MPSITDTWNILPVSSISREEWDRREDLSLQPWHLLTTTSYTFPAHCQQQFSDFWKCYTLGDKREIWPSQLKWLKASVSLKRRLEKKGVKYSLPLCWALSERLEGFLVLRRKGCQKTKVKSSSADFWSGKFRVIYSSNSFSLQFSPSPSHH